MSEGERQTLAIRLYDNWQVTNTSDSLEIYCYDQGRKDGYNKSIDDFVKEIRKMIVQSENNGNYIFYAVEIKQAIAELADQLKEGVNINE